MEFNVNRDKVKKYAKYASYAVIAGGVIYLTGYCRGRGDVEKIINGLNDPLVEVADLVRKGVLNFDQLRNASDLIVSYGAERVDKLLSIMMLSEGSDILQQAEALGINAKDLIG